MGENSLITTYVILNASKSLIYLIILFMVFRRIKDHSSSVLWLMGYALTAFTVDVFQLARNAGIFPALSINGLLHLDEYTSLLLAQLLYQNLREFLGRERQWVVFVGGLVLSALLIFIDNVILIFLAWLGFTLLAVFVLFGALRKTRLHLHRNRIFYWFPVLLFAIANEITLFYHLKLESGYLRLGVVILLAYVVLRHRIPDMRDFIRQLLIYSATTFVIMSVYLVGVLAAENIFKVDPGNDLLWVGAGLAVLISLLFTPLIRLVRGIVNHLFNLQSYDPSQILREYSASISNILDLEKLVAMAVGITMRALEVEKGYLFLIDPEISENGENVFRLSCVRGQEKPPTLARGVLSSGSPIVHTILEERAPLLQYDLDFAPDFIGAPLAERKLFSGLMLDVYVPIFAKGEWIGLLALGPKPNSKYTDDDLNMLATLASQTGVALENARLVENLKQVNSQLREAYNRLDKVNHDLEKLESTKSNFISIASHELRTPLTVARGYAEMLLEEPALPDELRVMVNGIHKSTLRQHEIMDSMFDIAQLDASSLDFQKKEVFVTELICSVAQELAKVLSERNQELTVDLPQLPAIHADADLLRKLFYHLMINAVKFTPNNRKILVTGKQLPINNRDLPEGGVEIVVSDQGVGVDKNFQELIFTKFYQPGELINHHSTGKTKFKGSGVGLGLALSRGIVDAHGGKLWVESPGYDDVQCPGSDFHVILPLRAQGESKTVRMDSAVKLKL